MRAVVAALKPAQKEKLWRVLGMVVGLAAPWLLLIPTEPWVSSAVLGAVRDSYVPLFEAAQLGPPYKVGQVDSGLQKLLESQLKTAVLDRQLVIYLVVGAIVGLIAAVHRAHAHGSETRAGKDADFVGKTIALSAAMIVCVGAFLRFNNAGVVDYFAHWLVILAVIVVLLVIAAMWICGWMLHGVINKEKDAHKVKAATKAKSDMIVVAREEARSMVGRTVLVGGLPMLVLILVFGLRTAKSKPTHRT